MTNEHLLVDIACYFSERAVEARDMKKLSRAARSRAALYDEVASIVGNWIGRSDER